MNSNSNSKSDIEGSSSSSSSSSSSDEESSLNGGNGKNKQILFTATKESHFYEQLGAPTILYRYTPSSNSTPGSSPDPDPGPTLEEKRLEGPYGDEDADTIALLNKALKLLSEPRGSAVRNISTRASKDMKEYFYYHNGEVCKEMFKAKSAKEFQLRFATGKKTAQFLFKRLKPMLNG